MDGWYDIIWKNGGGERAAKDCIFVLVPHRVAFAANIPNSHADAHSRAVGPQRFPVCYFAYAQFPYNNPANDRTINFGLGVGISGYLSVSA